MGLFIGETRPWALLENIPTWRSLLAIAVALRAFVYLHDIFWYHRTHRRNSHGQLPPKYPTFIPYLGIGLPLAWNIRDAVQHFTRYNNEGTIARLPVFPGVKVFLYQDPLIIRQIWKISHLLDFRPMATHFFTKACGMAPDAAALYLTDTTGLKSVPLPGSGAHEQHRVHRIIHESDRQALAGRGFAPTIQAFRTAFDLRMEQFATDSWTEVDDFWTFIQDTAGAAEAEAIFGPNLLRLHPKFVRDFFDFDRVIPWLLKGMSFSKAERIRNKLLDDFQEWAKFVTIRSAGDKARDYGNEDYGVRDPHWGAEWTRYRHEYFRAFFDDDAIASHDLGVTWGALGNTVPATLMATIHVLQDQALQSRVRKGVNDLCGERPLSHVHIKELTTQTLLSAVYAETLRMYVTVFVPVVPLHGVLDLGKWRIPQGSYGLMNAGVAHKNKDVWNTRAGAHPVDSFWADRFIIDPADPLSGPVRPESRDKYGMVVKGDEPFCASEGLEGFWIPYGGGRNMCPGRFLAKAIMTYTMASLTRDFEVELPTGPIALGSDRFGMGVELPVHKIPFRIRKRTHG
ncbi:hypothetical protein S7711_09157 [Stachybotrys chartarum IBT 7711]|uniref:Cytochrome P450 n=1 Tax=Stachybotrys chartarum (strain CBS 109288 / IBT 7711) TaxID=1280523 RepID=A0A084B528_STACB|nr:hypothetical protein S7711_09157 [Stachybotrys chartarum IBT 7711]KFA55169.1 hypothetical protein S40293_09080 [Stachybotrys chartarum IBT 40293]KFA79455.1 hypothetical protein S40288_07578 [Stachybotrys chartarum IBT 40288]